MSSMNNALWLKVRPLSVVPPMWLENLAAAMMTELRTALWWVDATNASGSDIEQSTLTDGVVRTVIASRPLTVAQQLDRFRSGLILGVGGTSGKPEQYGTKMDLEGTRYTVVGIKPRRHPIIVYSYVLRRDEDERLFEVSERTISTTVTRWEDLR